MLAKKEKWTVSDFPHYILIPSSLDERLPITTDTLTCPSLLLPEHLLYIKQGAVALLLLALAHLFNRTCCAGPKWLWQLQSDPRRSSLKQSARQDHHTPFCYCHYTPYPLRCWQGNDGVRVVGAEAKKSETARIYCKEKMKEKVRQVICGKDNVSIKWRQKNRIVNWWNREYVC